MATNKTNYTFGGCMACRAPLCPDVKCITRQPCYCTAFMQDFFRDKQTGKFTDVTQMAHVVQRAHASTAIRYTQGKALGDLKVFDGDVPLNTIGGVDTFPYRVDSKSWNLKSNLKYTAEWAKPDNPLEFGALTKFLTKCKSKVSFNLDTMYPCCLQCNSIMDAEAMLVDMYIPPDGEDGLDTSALFTVKTDERTVTITRRSLKQREQLQRYRSMLDAYYLHRCMLGFLKLNSSEGGVLKPATPVATRMYVVFSWLALMITCVIKENTRLGIQKKVKQPHVYVGVLNLLISNFLFLMLRCHYGVDQDLFSVFHLCYMSELMLGTNFWDRAQFPTWDTWAGQNIKEYSDVDRQVQSVCSNLVILYEKRVRQLIVYLMDSPKVLDEDSTLIEKYKKFFVSKDELKYILDLHRDCVNHQASRNDVSPFIDEMGIVAILYPIRRNLRFSKAELWMKLDEWIRAHLEMEWENMKRVFPDMTQEQRRLVYNLQYLLELDALTEGKDMNWVLGKYTSEGLKDKVKKEPWCSNWKALYRLHKLGIAKTPLIQQEGF